MKRYRACRVFLIVCILVTAFCGCGKKDEKRDEARVQIVTTIFPYYDILRVLTENDPEISITMLIPAGKDSHSFEPTIQDMMRIQSADLLLYNSELTEGWIEKVKDAAKSEKRLDVSVTANMKLDPVLDHDDHEDDDDHSHMYEDHIWTSPKRMQSALDVISDALCKIDANNSEKYKKNAKAYGEKLSELSKEYEELINKATCKTIVFGDRFPFYYLCEDYGLTAYAAFDSCSSETEPSAGVMTKLCEVIRSEKIPVVYYLEQSSQKIADTLANETGAKKLLLHSCHTVTSKELEEGVSYLSLMKKNLENLAEGLNVK